MISTALVGHIEKDRVEKLNKLANDVLNVLDKPISQCEELASLIKLGVCFYHAGLLNHQRELIEDGFKEGSISFITATPTLALGVNLPANTVILSSIYRHGDNGVAPLPKMEVDQIPGVLAGQNTTRKGPR